ncbi:MAG TPA: NERD domain-containing protein [Planococcus sp. (in: firmicutes)]|nr:NERD domain-containing protein [Planococcus sp. (in: firmicutes)]
MKSSMKWILMIIAGIFLLPFLYFMWPGVFAFMAVASLVIIKAKLPVIKGWFGEWQVTRILDKLGEDYKIYNDLYVPKEDGGTSQIDHIVTSPYGIFVIETKHYTGWIFGAEHQPQWTQVIYKRKEKLYNPIRQNYGHIMSLKSYLGFGDTQVLHSIIAFSSQSTFKFKEPFKSAAVIQFPQLSETITGERNTILEKQELDEINCKLARLLITDRKEKQNVKRQHLRSVKNRASVKSKPLSSSASGTGKRTSLNDKLTAVPLANRPEEVGAMCTKCGSEMKLKKGRYGSFYGCSNYPICRHTKKISLSS